MLRIGLLSLMLTLISVAQIPSRSPFSQSDHGANRTPQNVFESPRKRFRPEVWSGHTDSRSLRRSRSYCVYPEHESQSVSFKPCSPAVPIRLVPSLKPLLKRPVR